METDKKESKCMCVLDRLLFLIQWTNPMTATWESTSTFSLCGGTWFPFAMKLSYLKTLILMREDGAKAIIIFM